MTNINKEQILEEGTISANPKGFGFVRMDTGEDLFVPPPSMKSLVPGDVVAFRREINPRNNQVFARVVTVKHRPESFWLGEVETSGPHRVLRADEAITPALRVHPSDLAGVVPGDVVQVHIPANHEVGNTALNVQVVANLGPRSVRDFDIRYAMAKWRLPTTFTAEELAEASGWPEPSVAAAVADGYADLTSLPLVTIDGESTRDFDDAVCLRSDSGGSTLWVAIADVAHYVRPGSALDRCAYTRGTSVYLPDRVLPMLPPALSTGLCSLNPGAIRLARVCEIRFNTAGDRTGYRFFPAVIRSHARLTYNQVAVDAYEGCPNEVVSMMGELKRWFTLMEPARKLRGLMEYRSLEPKLVTDENGDYGIEWIAPLSSHALVEECMLAANRAAAEQMKAEGLSRVFRHQDGLDPQKWEEAAQWMQTVLGEADVLPSLPFLQALLDKTEDKDLLAQLSFRLRRSMVPAVYDDTLSTHFSLGFEAYTHFTSPIRRYADLLVHRLLADASYQPPEGSTAQLSMTGRRAKLASRHPWERIKRRLLWASAPGEMTAQVIGQSPRSCRVSLETWDVLAILPSELLQSSGWQWDDTRRVWTRENSVVSEGSMVRVQPRALLTEGPLLELQGELLS